MAALDEKRVCMESGTAPRDTAWAMSQENVEIVRTATEAMIGGDAATALDALDPDVEWHATVGGIDEGRIYHGSAEVALAFIDYFQVWEKIELRADDYMDTAGDDEVVVFFHEVAMGREREQW